jgi:predicted transcriptional regulator
MNQVESLISLTQEIIYSAEMALESMIKSLELKGNISPHTVKEVINRKLEIEEQKLELKILLNQNTNKDIEISELIKEYLERDRQRKPTKSILTKLKKDFDFIN